MRPLEFLLALSILAALILPLFNRLRGAALAQLISFLPALAAVLHLLVEKPRWQMIPLYLFSAGILARAVMRSAGRQPPASRPPRPGWSVLGVVVLLLGVLPPTLVPVPALPNPGGPYPVGTTTFYWVDESRTGIYTPSAGDPRRLMVQAWYPAQPAPGSRRAPYIEELNQIGPYLAQEQMGMPAFTIQHINLAKTNAWVDAPFAPGQGSFPVLVFSHGWTGMRGQNTYQMEALASRGYVVFSADHTYGANAVVFPDGELVPHRPDALPYGVSEEQYDLAARKLGQAWVGDIRFVLDQAGRLDSGELSADVHFAGRLDLDRVGIFGHSTGGGAAVETCWIDSRCKAGMAMDAWLIPYDRQIPQEGLQQPFLFLRSWHWNSRRNTPLVSRLDATLNSDQYALRLEGSYHDSFSDMPSLLPLLSVLRTGRLFAPYNLHDLVNLYSIAFFDRHLKGIESPLFEEGLELLPGVQLGQDPQ